MVLHPIRYEWNLFGFLMQSVCTTKATILAELQFFGSCSFIFCSCIIAPLTLGARKSNNISHFLILYLNAGINCRLHLYFIL